MRYKLALVIAFASLAACGSRTSVDNASEQAASQANQTASLFLACNVKVSDPGKPIYNDVKIFGVPASEENGQHLGLYNQDEKIFREACNSSMLTCAIEVNEDFIRERGYDLTIETENKLNVTTMINRRTGRIEQMLRAGTNVISSYEGECKPTQQPEIGAPKL